MRKNTQFLIGYTQESLKELKSGLQHYYKHEKHQMTGKKYETPYQNHFNKQNPPSL